jgi:hypothetical protein
MSHAKRDLTLEIMAFVYNASKESSLLRLLVRRFYWAVSRAEQAMMEIEAVMGFLQSIHPEWSEVQVERELQRAADDAGAPAPLEMSVAAQYVEACIQVQHITSSSTAELPVDLGHFRWVDVDSTAGATLKRLGVAYRKATNDFNRCEEQCELCVEEVKGAATFWGQRCEDVRRALAAQQQVVDFWSPSPEASTLSGEDSTLEAQWEAGVAAAEAARALSGLKTRSRSMRRCKGALRTCMSCWRIGGTRSGPPASPRSNGMPVWKRLSRPRWRRLALPTWRRLRPTLRLEMMLRRQRTSLMMKTCKNLMIKRRNEWERGWLVAGMPSRIG